MLYQTHFFCGCLVLHNFKRISTSMLHKNSKSGYKTAKKMANIIKMDKKRNIDFSRYKMRNVAFKFMYMGWDYCGLAAQDTTENTIIHQIFDCLEKTKLIESRLSCDLAVCGRTDKGVSAFHQVISLKIRSNLEAGFGIILDSGANSYLRDAKSKQEELDYLLILNRHLPTNIRMLGWCPVDDTFSARYSCISRTYRYIFPRANLDLEKMRAAAALLIGLHDFRNFCTVNCSDGRFHFYREILSVNIRPVDNEKSETEKTPPRNATSGIQDMFMLEVKGKGFLYHQIRYTMTVLLLVASGREEVDIVSRLLDVEGEGRDGRPTYLMASEIPLIFFDSEYDNLKWISSPESVKGNLRIIQNDWLKLKTQETHYRMCLENLTEQHCSKNSGDDDDDSLSYLPTDSVLGSVCRELSGSNKKKPMFDRQRAMTVQQKIDKFQPPTSKLSPRFDDEEEDQQDMEKEELNDAQEKEEDKMCE